MGCSVRSIGLAAIAVVLGIFLLCCFLLKTRHNILYGILITLCVVLIVAVLCIILESIIGPIELP